MDNRQSLKNKSVSLRFYAELNDFLSNDKKQSSFEYFYKGPLSLKEAIESIGVPHSMVDMLLVNGESVSFTYWLKQGDRISVFPVFESLDVSSLLKIRKNPLRETKFILDAHLGKLAKYLRMLGFDTLYKNDFEDSLIIALATEQGRIILTRDKEMLKSKKINHGYFVREIDKHEQLKEVVAKFDLYSQVKPFTRCMTCNCSLIEVEKEDINDRIEPDTAEAFNEFYLCANCNKVFWKGSHFERMYNFIHNQLI